MYYQAVFMEFWSYASESDKVGPQIHAIIL